MSTRLDTYQQRKARAELRRELLWPLLVFGINAPAFWICGCLHLASRTGRASLLFGLVFAVVGWGLLRCQSWARWPAAGTLALNAIWALGFLEDVRALPILSELREAGIACDLPFGQAKLGKQLKRAEQSGARFALVVGSELPELQLKVLACRTEEPCHVLGLADWLSDRLQQPDGPLLA